MTKQTETHTVTKKETGHGIPNTGYVSDLPKALFSRAVHECMAKALKGYTHNDAVELVSCSEYTLYDKNFVANHHHTAKQTNDCLVNKIEKFHPILGRDLQNVECYVIDRVTMTIESGAEDKNVLIDLVAFSCEYGQMYITITHNIDGEI